MRSFFWSIFGLYLRNEIDLLRGSYPDIVLGKITAKDLVDVDAAMF